MNTEQNQTQNINDWIAQHEKEIEAEQKQNSKYVKLVVGDNIMEILKIPAKKRTEDEQGKPLKFGAKYDYQVKLPDGTQKILAASVVLDRMVFECMKRGIFNITIVKTGKDKDTRYDIKQLH